MSSGTAVARVYLDRAGALRSLTPLVELLTLSAKKQPQGDARGRVAWLRPKIVGCLRRIYRVNISARWFISTFGSHEARSTRGVSERRAPARSR